VNDLDFSILIIGGGPAGLSAALSAARELDALGREVSVALVERKKAWGCPVQCAGFVPRLFARETELPDAAVVERTNELRLFTTGGGGGGGEEPRDIIRAPGFIIHREVWEESLAESAEALGVKSFQPATVRALDAESGEALVSSGEGKLEVRAEVIIAADGPESAAHAALGAGEMKLARGLQRMYPAAGSFEPEIHFDLRYGAGYAWAFPKGDEAEVGLALDEDRTERFGELLDEFAAGLAARGLISGEKLASAGKAIPVGGPPPQTVRDRILLVGDAAGQTNPLTGAGIPQAVACGEMAGKWAARSVAAGDEKALAEYEREWRDLFGGYLSRALAAREWLAARPETSRPESEFAAATLAAWKKGAVPGADKLHRNPL